MYNKQTWLDEIPDMTKPIYDSSGKQKTDPQTGRPLFELVQVGTRITSNRLNTMEGGIEAAHTLVEQLAKELGGNFVVPVNGTMGLQCSAQGLKASWTSGIAYVGGRRYQVAAGEVSLNPTQGQYLYVDTDGVVKKTTTKETAAAGLLLFYVATDTSGVLSTTDHRVNISLDEIIKKLENDHVPDASLTQKGKVQLTNATNSTSESLVPNAKALSTARQEAISAAAMDATTKANTAETNAKNYVDDNFRKPSDLTQANLVKNSSFLQGSDYWQSNNVRNWGSYSNTYAGFFMAVDTTTSIPLNQYATLTSEPIGVSQTIYRLTALLHTAGSLADSRVYIEVVNNANNNIIGSLLANNQTWWHRKSTLITIPAGVSAIVLRLVVNNFPSAGTAGFSRISLTEGTQDFPYSQEMDIRALYEQTQLVKQSGVDAKNGVVGAINAKNGNASTNDTWPTLVSKINAIQTGPKYASGTVDRSTTQVRFTLPSGNGAWDRFPITVTGLAFHPNRIIIYLKNNIGTRDVVGVYDYGSFNPANGYGYTRLFEGGDVYVYRLYENSANGGDIEAWVSDQGFQLPIFSTDRNLTKIEWEAFRVLEGMS
ncbi:phage tail protein [Paenibacillus illinoisensis]|uniref:phage tail protein n=1 Tax=Paenibacillus illinoisensis TaxID=59845 RepID=UPI002042245C|nr:phage tail protein [Paenibacillus illinoisensis]MCM3206377.1 phage tail protein [Paenibacillus illinoisensis]